MIEATFIDLVSQLGFPIAIVLWFMLRTEKVIGANTEALNKIREIIFKCNR